MRPIVVFLLATAAILTLLAPAAWLVLLTDGLFVLAVAVAAAGWGAWPAAWLTSGHGRVGRDPSARRWGVLKQALLASSLGFGALSPLVLAIGVLGRLNAPVAWAMVAIGATLGAWRVAIAARAHHDAAESSAPARSLADGALRYVAALALAPVAAVMLFGASLPPGVLWPEEAGGYDALEYHLQAPREYFEAGQIHFLPHNVYASFPQQIEMLYLLLMHLAGDLNAAAIAAQLLHALFGLLAVAAAAAWAPPGKGALAALLVAGGAPWMAYLGCLAYVELGMLFFAALAAGLLLEQIEATNHAWPLALAGGLFAGMAAGCKYTAAAMVAAALGVAWLVAMRGSSAVRMRRFGLFAGGSLLAFSPWLIRNAAFTGNPVYPFAYAWFGGAAWSPEQAAQWDAGHRFSAHDELPSSQPSRDEPSSQPSRDEPSSQPSRDGNGVATKPVERASVPAGRQGRLPHSASQAREGHPPHSTASDAREGTGLSAGHATVARAKAAFHELFSSGMFGLALFAAALAGAFAGDRRTLLLGVWTLVMLAIWATLTHMPGRFAVPVIIPLALLAGGVGRLRSAWPATAVVLIAAIGALHGGWKLQQKLNDVDRRWNGQLHLLPGLADAMSQEWNYVNNVTPPGSYAWLIGEARGFYVRDRRFHYTVAFNRDPWIAAAEAGATPAERVAWLRREGVTHVVFNWLEIERLRRTYGFSPIVTPEWAAALAEHGLIPLRDPALPKGVDVYIVSQPE